MSLPEGPFQIVYADPPWFYNDRRTSKTRFGGGAVAHYPTMSTREICAIPVHTIVAEDAYLFMWATWPTLIDAMQVMSAWGFAYKTCAFNWFKSNPVSETPFFGIGFYTASNTEICLLGVRGKPWRAEKKPSQVIVAPRREHSRKPDEVRDKIVRMCGDVPRLEMFSRQAADGWVAWGNQLDHFDGGRGWEEAVPCAGCQQPTNGDETEETGEGRMHAYPCASTWRERDAAKAECDLCGRQHTANEGGITSYGSCCTGCAITAHRAGMKPTRAMSVDCPTCGAAPHKRCKAADDSHDARFEAAKQRQRAGFSNLVMEVTA